MKDHNVPLWLQCVSCLVVKILRQFERRATWKQDELEHKRGESRDEPLKEMKDDKVDFRKQTGVLRRAPDVHT